MFQILADLIKLAFYGLSAIWWLAVQVLKGAALLVALAFRAISGLIARARASRSARITAGAQEQPREIEVEDPAGVILWTSSWEDDDEGFRHILRGRSLDKAIADESRKLAALYRRKDRMQAVNAGDGGRYENTKAWRGLMWDIEDTESTIERLERALA